MGGAPPRGKESAMNWQIRATNQLVLGVMAGMVVSTAALADTVYVNGTCDDDGWTGQSEVCAAPDGPKKTIQAGIDVANDGDEVVLADGVYAGPGNTELDFLTKEVVLRSINGPGTCVVDGENRARAIVFFNQGLVEQRVEGVSFERCTAFVAGAVYVQSSSPTFANCNFHGNSAEVGGTMQIRAGSNVRISDCQFDSNFTTAVGAGGIFCRRRLSVWIRAAVDRRFSHNPDLQ
jgi:hypothetical protein